MKDKEKEIRKKVKVTHVRVNHAMHFHTAYNHGGNHPGQDCSGHDKFRKQDDMSIQENIARTLRGEFVPSNLKTYYHPPHEQNTLQPEQKQNIDLADTLPLSELKKQAEKAEKELNDLFASKKKKEEKEALKAQLKAEIDAEKEPLKAE